MSVTSVFEQSSPPVRGMLHHPENPCGCSLALTHGAGSNAQAPLLRALAEAFAAEGWTVLRFDLPYRQERQHGSPFPANAARDREGIRRAAELLARLAPGRLFLGGHSYGGRQTTLLAAETSGLAEALLLLSYPLHPPQKPANLRTAHFSQLSIPAMFVHGSRDPFATEQEMRAALELIPSRTELLLEAGAGHSLPAEASFVSGVVQHFLDFAGRG